MTTAQLDAYFKSFLDFASSEAVDPSLNGIQVDNNGNSVTTVAFAVDASLETIERAAAAGAGCLFVHHGFFWGKPLAVQGLHYKRIMALLHYNMALYACHIPLDVHPELGNNAALADLLNLCNREPFGIWHGISAGILGELLEPVSIDGALQKLFPPQEPMCSVLPFGPTEIHRVAIVSGSGCSEFAQAINAHVDLFVTGSADHQIYHMAKEAGIHVICGGHYATEVHGVKRIAQKLGRETGIETFFIDIPTRL